MIKLLQILVIALWLTGIGLLILLRSTPDINTEVILEETALTNTWSHEAVAKFKKYTHQQLVGVKSTNSYVLRAKDKIEKILTLTDTLESHFARLYEQIYDLDDAQKEAQFARETLAQMKEILIKDINPSAIENDWSIPNFNLSVKDVDLRKLQAAQFEFEAFQNVEAFIDYLLASAESANIKLDRWPPPPSQTFSVGLMASNAPRDMMLHKKERIQIRISKELKEDILKSLPNNHRAEIDTLMTGNIMTVKLIGEDFDISAYDEEEQGVIAEGFTQWEFDVTPKKTGKHPLLVKVGIVYFVPNLGSTKKFFPVMEKEIDVKVDAVEWVASFASERWEFLISTFVLPALVWSISRWKYRRRKESKQSEPSRENGKY